MNEVVIENIFKDIKGKYVDLSIDGYVVVDKENVSFEYNDLISEEELKDYEIKNEYINLKSVNNKEKVKHLLDKKLEINGEIKNSLKKEVNGISESFNNALMSGI